MNFRYPPYTVSHIEPSFTWISIPHPLKTLQPAKFKKVEANILKPIPIPRPGQPTPFNWKRWIIRGLFIGLVVYKWEYVLAALTQTRAIANTWWGAADLWRPLVGTSGHSGSLFGNPILFPMCMLINLLYATKMDPNLSAKIDRVWDSSWLWGFRSKQGWLPRVLVSNWERDIFSKGLLFVIVEITSLCEPVRSVIAADNIIFTGSSCSAHSVVC